MSVRVTAEIIINGEVVPCDAGALYRRDNSLSIFTTEHGEAAITGFEITWGRDDYLDSSTSPSSATFHIADTGRRRWSSRVLSGSAVGMTVEIWARIFDDESDYQWPSQRVFNGRIQSATAVPAYRLARTNTMMWDVTIKASDRSADLGNVNVSNLVWARNTMLYRANQIHDLAIEGNAGIEEIYFWPGYVSSYARPMEEENISALELLSQFYESMGDDAWAYDPHGNVIRQAIRLDQYLEIGLEITDAERGSVAPYVGDLWVDGVRYYGIAISGGEVTETPEFSAEVETNINRLENNYYPVDYNHEREYTFYTDDVAAGDARRVYEWDTWLDQTHAVTDTMTNVYLKVTTEGSQPKHPGLTVQPTHVFPTIERATWMLQTWENTRPVFIWGDRSQAWIQSGVNYPPVYAPIGGTTYYDAAEGWSVELELQRFYNRKSYVDSFRWSDIDTRMTWGHADEIADGLQFDECVSWNDLAYVSRDYPTIRSR